MSYARRALISRDYRDPMGQILYEVRISKLPLNDLERFHSNVLKHVAVHIPDRLLELLIEGLSSEEEARSALNEAVAGGGPVEVRLREDAPLQVIDKLATSSWREGNEMNNHRFQIRGCIKDIESGETGIVDEIKEVGGITIYVVSLQGQAQIGGVSQEWREDQVTDCSAKP